jgi:L-lysine 2,3-aminomutase
MITILVLLSLALIAIGVSGYMIHSSQIAQQQRKARIKLLQEIVRRRFESLPGYAGDRHAFDHAIEQVPVLFGNSGAVIAAFQRYRDAEVSGTDSLAQHHLTEMLREMCRDVKIDTGAIREELPLMS